MVKKARTVGGGPVQTQFPPQDRHAVFKDVCRQEGVSETGGETSMTAQCVREGGRDIHNKSEFTKSCCRSTRELRDKDGER